MLSSTPKKAKAGSNWWGSPPERMRRVEVEAAGEATYAPSRALMRKRGLVETLRLLAPMTQAVLAAVFAAVVVTLLERFGFWTYLLGGLVWMLRRLPTAEQFARTRLHLGLACAFLCGAKSGFITGQNILLDGGAYPGTM